ncbi:MAG: glucosamine-6-phosphate deaminase [Clostridia bacterium]|nr:glucosamine-6-phosphate deaminase [Clostridia bacterium]
MQLKVFKNYQEMSKYASQIVLDVVAKNPQCTLGFATGSTPLGLYGYLKQACKDGTSFRDVSAFNLDEYVGLDASHPQSYKYFMQHNLFNELDILPQNCHIPCGVATDLQAECQNYSKQLAKHTIALQILGIGGNGHIAFNEPGTSFQSTTHVVQLSPKTIADNARFFDSIDQVPTSALTMGIGEIMKAQCILVLANGKNKAQAVFNMVKGPISTSCPASVLQTHPNCIVVCDEESASLLN